MISFQVKLQFTDIVLMLVLSVFVLSGCSNKAGPPTTASFWSAIEADDVPAVERHLQEGASVDQLSENGSSPLHIAARSGSINVARFLVERGARIDATNMAGLTPLQVAISENKIQMVKALVDLGSDVNRPSDKGQLPLAFARGFGYSDIEKYLSSRGARLR